MALVTVDPTANAATAAAYCDALEHGSLLFLAHTLLSWKADDRAALLQRDQQARSHKNIAYHLDADRLMGVDRRSGQAETLRRLLRIYAKEITALLAALLAPYARCWRIDYTSFRPEEEAGRRLPWRARNDLLHIDAFPSRPTNGDRILRVFTNVHPSRPRCWVTAEPFDLLVGRFADRPGLSLPRHPSPWHALRRRLLRHVPSAGGALLRRSPYDAFMLRLHDHLKADARFQATAARETWQFPPGSSWIAFTDALPHAALSGQFALEQTYFVPRAAMRHPERAPVSILEKLCRIPLTDASSLFP